MSPFERRLRGIQIVIITTFVGVLSVGIWLYLQHIKVMKSSPLLKEAFCSPLEPIVSF